MDDAKEFTTSRGGFQIRETYPSLLTAMWYWVMEGYLSFIMVPG